MSGAALYIKKDMHLSDVQIEILSGISNIYSLIGSAAAGRTSDWIRHRYTIVVACAVFFIGALLMGLATTYAFLMVGRFVAGIGVGYALMIAPVYTAEVAPASSRGFLTSFPEVFINTGILFGYLSHFGFSKLPLHLGWRFMLGIGAIPSVLLAVGVLAMPESPRWLVMHGRLGDAKKVLCKTSDSDEEAESRLSDIKEAAGLPPDCKDDVVSVPFTQTAAAAKECGRSSSSTQPQPSDQASGIDAVVLHSPRIFERAGITSDKHKLLATVAVGFSKTIFILVATIFLDRVGRRPLLLTSVGGMILSLVTLATSLTIIDHSTLKIMWAIGLSIMMLLTFVASFSIGLGPIASVYSSETFPLRLRAQGTSIGTGVNRLISGTISMTFLSLSKAITTSGAFFLFAGIATVWWIFFFTCLPETRGRGLEEMDELFGDFKWQESLHRKSSGNGHDKQQANRNGHIQFGDSGDIHTTTNGQS
ncbi:Polyol transporter 5 [Ancistrocladus abbreviatus]